MSYGDDHLPPGFFEVQCSKGTNPRSYFTVTLRASEVVAIADQPSGAMIGLRSAKDGLPSSEGRREVGRLMIAALRAEAESAADGL